jgi:hypothetical protein
MTLRQAAGYRYKNISVLVFSLWQATENYQVKYLKLTAYFAETVKTV